MPRRIAAPKVAMIATQGAKLLHSNAPQARLYTEAIPFPPILVGHAAGLDESKGPRSEPSCKDEHRTAA
ncbi:hypothetical protein BDBG_06674 [Blastomyces gilchristii SLH14081]|uniref:Uncharacterized protein n=1 Tax=Blastomyces gilchristii (strain SLH14081) TaxID=559298 RepID=A0A179US25_BLAGS|nr:uncharacterized protein BDBG_06674 [Blastomyces gilchristii SLH14081]OAT10896.1 hypothetical protein BDBG_06674 [Blastomyces gilchristii SLH14081]